MAGPLHSTARIVSVVAGTLVALSCGTNVGDLAFLASSDVAVDTFRSMHIPRGPRNSPIR